MNNKVKAIEDAQEFVKQFAIKNNWSDDPNIDKFDHLHEELVEMSKLLRYKDLKARKKVLIENHQELIDGIGDLFFALCRLANQLSIDLEEAFNLVKDQIVSRYNEGEESIKK